MVQMKGVIDGGGFVRCPVCGNKTGQKARPDTYLKNLPLFCPKCRCGSLIDIEDGRVKAKKTEPRTR